MAKREDIVNAIDEWFSRQDEYYDSRLGTDCVTIDGSDYNLYDLADFLIETLRLDNE
jgi:hypothetical protein